MKSVKELFKDKQFDKEALKYIENAINEFDELFGKYVPRDELIKSIKDNIDTIQFVDKLDLESKCAAGMYNRKNKLICVLASFDEENRKSIFFHEFLHAIATKGHNSGFHRQYSHWIETNKTLYAGWGWNEGIVQMMTKERDRKFAKGEIIEGYPILTVLAEKFSNLFGKQELLDMYFNKAENFVNRFNDYMKDKKINAFDFYDVDGLEFLIDFDIIHEHEKEAFNRRKNENAERLLRYIFGEGKTDHDIYSEELIKAQEEIANVYVDILKDKNIENIKEFDDILKDTTELYKVLSKDISISKIESLIEKLSPKSLKDIDKLSEENKSLISCYTKCSDFLEANTTDKLNMLSTAKGDFIKFFKDKLDKNHYSLKIDFYKKMLYNLYHESKVFETQNIESTIQMIGDISEYIVDNNIPFENIKIIYNSYSFRNIYELYNYQEDGSYKKIITIAKSDDNTEIEENENGKFKVVEKNGQQRLINFVGGKTEKPYETISFESINETRIKTIEKKLEKRIENLERLQELEAHETVVYDALQGMNNLKKEKEDIYNQIKEESKAEFPTSQIQVRVVKDNKTIQDVENAVKKLTIQDKDKEER